MLFTVAFDFSHTDFGRLSTDCEHVVNYAQASSRLPTLRLQDLLVRYRRRTPSRR